MSSGKLFFLLLLCSAIIQKAIAQKENNVWVFGDKLGIDFNESPPRLITTAIQTFEACASICDQDGKLLFYVSGNTVWNREHKVMPNGFGLSGGKNNSSTMGVTILPIANNSNLYYIFNLLEREALLGTFTYSVVDISLNGGLGDVVSGMKNVYLAERMSEKIITTSACSGQWLLTHHLDSALFYAYPILPDGAIGKPVVSATAGINKGVFYAVGEMKMSSDYKKIALANCYGSELSLFDFDNFSGKVSNYQKLSTAAKPYYGVEFSPNNSKLYSTVWMDHMEQWDLSLLPAIDAVQSSSYRINFGVSRVRGMRIGPDKKLYIHNDLRNISRINKPDEKGGECELELDVAYLTGPSGSDYINFGTQSRQAFKAGDTVIKVTDTTVCFQEKISLQGRAGFDWYTWHDKSTKRTDSIDQSGHYWVRSSDKKCHLIIDTFKVQLVYFDLNLRDTFICKNEKLMLDASINGASGYLWQNGSEKSSFETADAGIYWVEATVAGCKRTDTLRVSSGVMNLNLGEDRQVCNELPYYLRTGIQDARFVWNDGSTNPDFAVMKNGTYFLTANKNGCVESDTVTIQIVKCNGCISIPNAFTPNQDARNDQFRPLISCPALHYSLSVFNRYGQQIFQTNNPLEAWDGTVNRQEQESGVYYYLIKTKFDFPGTEDEIYKGDITLIR